MSQQFVAKIREIFDNLNFDHPITVVFSGNEKLQEAFGTEKNDFLRIYSGARILNFFGIWMDQQCSKNDHSKSEQ